MLNNREEDTNKFHDFTTTHTFQRKNHNYTHAQLTN